jgi:hypothetical protein
LINLHKLSKRHKNTFKESSSEYLIAFKLKFSEDDPQVEPLCRVLTGLGKESAIYDIEKEDLLGFGVSFFRGTFEEEH